jgi:hypothetical protein
VKRSEWPDEHTIIRRGWRWRRIARALLRMDLTADERATIEGIVGLPAITDAQWGAIWDIMQHANQPAGALNYHP